MGQPKEGNERPVHITLSYDDTQVLKGAVENKVQWDSGDIFALRRVYMVLDAAVGAAGYYPESQPSISPLRTEFLAQATARRLRSLNEDLVRRGKDPVAVAED